MHYLVYLLCLGFTLVFSNDNIYLLNQICDIAVHHKYFSFFFYYFKGEIELKATLFSKGFINLENLHSASVLHGCY